MKFGIKLRCVRPAPGSDLYSLGATIICLLAGIKSASISDLIDETYCINTKLLPQSLDSSFKFWLKKMVAPKLSDRFPNAVTALGSLQSGGVFVPTNDETITHFTSQQIKMAVKTIVSCVTAAVVFRLWTKLLFGYDNPLCLVDQLQQLIINEQVAITSHPQHQVPSLRQSDIRCR